MSSSSTDGRLSFEIRGLGGDPIRDAQFKVVIEDVRDLLCEVGAEVCLRYSSNSSQGGTRAGTGTFGRGGRGPSDIGGRAGNGRFDVGENRAEDNRECLRGSNCSSWIKKRGRVDIRNRDESFWDGSLKRG